MFNSRFVLSQNCYCL